MNQTLTAEQKKNILDHLLEKTYTKTSLMRRSRLLKEMMNFHIFYLKEASTLQPSLDQYFIHNPQSALEQGFLLSMLQPLSSITHTTVNDFFQLLDDTSKHVQSVILYVPFLIPELAQEEIGTWFKHNLGNHFVYEINLDPELIGGCAISYRGVHRDQSLRSRIIAQQSEILKSLREFRHT
jgi:hypothetical protein